MTLRTDAQGLQTWFNREVVGIFKQHHAFDPEGIFIGDATYLFVPDNPRYEGSSRMLFDEHHHPVEGQKLTLQQRARCTWRRCYKLVSLLHTNRAAEFFLYGELVLTAGQDHEGPLLYRLVEKFGIDILIPVRSNMEIYQDVVGLAQAGQLSFQPWAPAPPGPQPIPLHALVNRDLRRWARGLLGAGGYGANPAASRHPPRICPAGDDRRTASATEVF